MALNAEIHGRVQREIELEIGAVQFMTTHASHRLVTAGIDHVLSDRVRSFMCVGMTGEAELRVGSLKVPGIIGPVRGMAVGAIHPIMGQVGRMDLRILCSGKMAAETEVLLLGGEE